MSMACSKKESNVEIQAGNKEFIIVENITEDIIAENEPSRKENVEYILAENTVNDFIIVDNILKNYYGREKEVIIPSGVEIIGFRAFERNNIIESVYIPDGVITIGDGAFLSCINLKNIRFPDTLKTIEANAFDGCVSLQKINLPNGLTNILYCAFTGSGLTEITIPEGTEIIAMMAFSYCENLVNVTLPDTLISIGSGAFWECQKLKNVIIPLSVEFIGQSAFFGVNSREVTFLNENINNDDIFMSSDLR
jgi:hypothetical protein